ncbi:MAG TPA: DUF1013 domain-containing protein [Azospirillaceae bacterium]|nr:DUF1013 domain-containing protein [Azospirillaceae bacterium]
MAQPLMPKATAVWLVENTTLTFEQVAAFCGLHELEVQAIADGEVAVGMVGLDPVVNGQLTRKEIARCEANPDLRLQMVVADLPQPVSRSKGPRYTPITKRGDKPDGIAWLLKFHPELSEAALCRLIGTTKPTIAAVRDKTHWNAANIKPRSPVLLGLCSARELEEALALAARQNGGKPQHDNSAVMTYEDDSEEAEGGAGRIGGDSAA